jgi:2'-5' RNA ligase
MRHIIAHLIRGEAKEAHEAITRELVEKLDAFPIHDRIVPHLTLKRWFELDEIGMEEVYKVLDEFVATHMQSNYRLHGFNNFGEGVIYVDVDPSPEMSKGAKELMDALHSVKDMTFDEYGNRYVGERSRPATSAHLHHKSEKPLSGHRFYGGNGFTKLKPH